VAKVVKFGFPAFLNVLYENDKPQRRAIRNRLRPSSDGGYDFHLSLRTKVYRHIMDGTPIVDLINSASTISQPAERKSVVAGLEQLGPWWASMQYDVAGFSPVVFESPRQLFSVRFDPVFCFRDGGRTTAMHVWKSARLELVPARTYEALKLIAEAYQDQGEQPADIGVLSLQDPAKAYFLSDAAAVSATATAANLVERIETIIEEIIDGETGLPPTQPEDRPPH